MLEFPFPFELFFGTEDLFKLLPNTIFAPLSYDIFKRPHSIPCRILVHISVFFNIFIERVAYRRDREENHFVCYYTANPNQLRKIEGRSKKMRVTRDLEEKDAEKIAGALNDKYPRQGVASERWPVVVLIFWGTVEATFEMDPKSGSFKVELTGEVYIGQQTVEFSKFNPDLFPKNAQCIQLKNNMRALAHNILLGREKKMSAELSEIKATLKLIKRE